jgi:hypothetical protein
LRKSLERAPGIVLVERSSANVRSLDIDRLWASLTGIAIAPVLLGIFWLLGVRDKEEKRVNNSPEGRLVPRDPSVSLSRRGT